jgi:hypothetical protein
VAVRSVIDIAVNDGAFQRFNDLFQKYQKGLNATPAAWRSVAQAQTKAAAAFHDQVALEVQSIANAKMIAQAHAQAARMSRTTGDVWRDMARNTKTVAGNITTATASLMRWASLTSVFSGLVSAGGLFGINRMAEGVAFGRRSSLGLGVGYGEQKAFTKAFGRVVEPDSFLSGVNEALHSATGKTALFGAGLRAGDLTGSTGDVSLKVLEHARTLAKSSNPDFDVQTMQARGLDKFMSLQDFQRLRSTSDAEFATLERRYSRNTSAFGVGGKDQLAYQNFVTTLDEVPLIPGLENLSRAAVNVVDAFLNSPQLKKWIDGAALGLEKFASYVGTEEFQSKVRNFVTGLGVIADKTASVISGLGWGSDPGAKGIRDRVAWSKAHHEGRWTEGEMRARVESGKDYWWTQPFKQIWNIDKAAGSQHQLLGLVRKLEGSGDSAVSPAGAIGRYQIMPGTARQYGFDETRLKDPAYNETVARKILADLSKRFNGNVDEILTAYNAGPGTANRFRRAGHNMRTLPLETQRYLEHAHKIQGVNITVTNAAGSNVIVQSSQLSAGRSRAAMSESPALNRPRRTVSQTAELGHPLGHRRATCENRYKIQ